MAFTLCFTNYLAITCLLTLVYFATAGFVYGWAISSFVYGWASSVSSMDGLSPVSYQNALDPTTTNDNGCQVCSDDFKRVMRLRGNDINAQLNFFSNNLRHKDFSLLELREQVRARCASVSCLKEAVTKGDVYNKLNLPTCKSFADKIKSLPDEAQSFLSYLSRAA